MSSVVFRQKNILMKRARGDDEEGGNSKIFNLDPEVGTLDDGNSEASLICTLPPCNKSPVKFRNNEDFESHYRSLHCMNCSECKKIFPSEHILNLHIIENHDSISLTRKSRGEKIYQCLIESCDRVCSTEWKRKRHLIDKHEYPPNFYFGVIKYGLSKSNR